MRRRKAFTLVELLVALALGGTVLLGAHAVLVSLTNEAQEITTRSAAADRAANGMRVLHALVGQLEVGTSGTRPFAGDPTRVAFSSWCAVPAGWAERCRVTLEFDTANGTHVLEARIAGQRPLILARGFRAGAFRYLNSAANGGQWFRLWGRGITAPLAIGVLLDADTIIVPIGERG